MEGSRVRVAKLDFGMAKDIKAVLFDLDGTLIDSIGLLLASMRYAFEGFDGEEPVTEDWVAGIGTPLMTQIRAYTKTEDQAIAVRDRYRDFQRDPGAMETLAELHAEGKAMAVVTAKIDWLAQRSLDWTGLAKYIPVVVGSESTQKHKPNPEPVRFALNKLGVAPEHALFIGDSPHDIGAGNAAGVLSVGATWGPFTEEKLTPHKPQYLLHDIRYLPLLLSSID
jgi:pyrophosphatase PpaX